MGNPAESGRLEEESTEQACQGFPGKVLQEWSSAAVGHQLEARKITNEGKSTIFKEIVESKK